MLKSVYISVILIILSAYSIYCGSDNTGTGSAEENPDGIGVILIDRTVLRLDPLLYSAIVGYINKGEKVRIFGHSNQKTFIGNMENYWYRVDVNSGHSGWIFGGNIKIFPSDDAGKVDDFISEFMEEEIEKMSEELAGRWWSVDKYGTFTNYSLDIYSSGKYRSLKTNSAAIEGEYNLNFKNYEIIFLNGSYFGNKINYLSRGSTFILQKTGGNEEFRFKRISTQIKDSDKDTGNGEES